MRLDVYLCENGYFESRSKALSAFKEGRVYVNGKNGFKPSYDVKETDQIEIKGEGLKYVGRGGLKMEGAINAFGLDVTDMICVDVGASTGGFTDCLLQNGAKKVYAVDCGRGQLHKKLADDKRVVNIENFNARELTVAALGEKCDIAVMDVSFISQTLLHGAVFDVLKDGGLFVSLIKPQFEAGKSGIGKGGIVKDETVRAYACQKVISGAEQVGFTLLEKAVSPITGGDGNTEYIALFKKETV